MMENKGDIPTLINKPQKSEVVSKGPLSCHIRG